MLKNFQSMSISVKYIKNGVLKGTIWKVMDLSNVSKLIDQIDEKLLS